MLLCKDALRDEINVIEMQMPFINEMLLHFTAIIFCLHSALHFAVAATAVSLIESQI